jgi:hypothetical protein
MKTKSRSLVICPHGDMRANLLGKTPVGLPIGKFLRSRDFVKRRKLILWVDFRRGKLRDDLSYRLALENKVARQTQVSPVSDLSPNRLTNLTSVGLPALVREE